MLLLLLLPLFLTAAATTTTVTAFLVPRRQPFTAAATAALPRIVVAVGVVPPPSTAAAVSSRSCSVELVEPTTGCHVVLLGCFHGSQSSAEDVQSALRISDKQNLGTVDNINNNYNNSNNNNYNNNNNNNNNVVVALELCPQRYLELQRRGRRGGGGDMVVVDEPHNGDKGGWPQLPPKQQQRIRRPWIDRYIRMIHSTYQNQNVATAVVTAFLGAASGLQTGILNLQPGLEFTTAMKIAADNDMHVILADQDVDTTLQRLGDLPNIALEMWRDFFLTATTKNAAGSSCEQDSFRREVTALHTALWGCAKQKQQQQVTLSAFLTRSDAAVNDLLRMTLTLLLLWQAVHWSLSQFCAMLTLNPASAAAVESSGWAVKDLADAVATTTTVVDDDSAMMGTGGLVTMVVINVALLLMTYLAVALPIARVVIRERDDHLTKGIRAACQLAAGQKNGRVVAVLGLLHVNGVALRLLQPQQQQQQHEP